MARRRVFWLTIRSWSGRSRSIRAVMQDEMNAQFVIVKIVSQHKGRLSDGIDVQAGIWIANVRGRKPDKMIPDCRENNAFLLGDNDFAEARLALV